MSVELRRKRAARRAKRRHRQAQEVARRTAIVRPAVLVSTIADPAELDVGPGPHEADQHTDCGRYGLRVKAAIGRGLVAESDRLVPGCTPIAVAEEEALRALHAEAAAAGKVAEQVSYSARPPYRQITPLGEHLLASAEPGSQLAARQLELCDRELITVELGGRRLSTVLERVPRPLRRAA